MQSEYRQTGRRKSSIARVILKSGKGKIIVNKIDFKKYFPYLSLQNNILQPLTTIKEEKKYDININVRGGGVSGQSEACQLAIAKILVEIDESYKKALKDLGFLTRDSRVVESKKYGRKKARKKFQFSKR